MKISKKSIKANTAIVNVDDVISPEISEPSTCAETCCKYTGAIECIKSAIDALGEVAADDELAKESIANLSVILLDLSC